MLLVQYFNREQLVLMQLQKEREVRITAELAKNPTTTKTQTNKKSPLPPKKTNHKKLVTFIHLKIVARKSGCYQFKTHMCPSSPELFKFGSF